MIKERDVRLRHKIPITVIEEARRNAPAEPLEERYEEELASARRRAYRAWKSAERRLRTAERKADKAPSPEVFAERDRLRLAVLSRLDELKRIEELMRAPVRGQNWSGKGSVRHVPKGRTL